MKYWVNFFVIQWFCLAGVRVLYQRLIKKRFRGALTQFLGLRLPMLDKKVGKRIWIHAPSLGEAKSLQKFLTILREEEPRAKIVFSTMTDTAMEFIHKNYPFIESAFYLPCDMSWIMRRWIRHIDPDMFIIMESGFWYNLMRELKAHKTKIALVSGRMSPLSYKRYKRFYSFSRELFSFIDQFCVQGEQDALRFKHLGVSEHKLFVTGNLKYDTKTLLSPELNIRFSAKDYVVTVASTHAQEEKLILKAIKDIRRPIKILLAPRHMERIPQVQRLLYQSKLRFCRLSSGPTGNEDVILIDQMGQLEACFAISHAAIMGGSFVRNIGGHNLLEPARYGIPVIYGPFMDKQAEIVSLFKRHDYGQQVSLPELCNTLERYCGDTAHKKKTEKMLEEIEGVSLHSWEKIRALQ